MKYIRIFFFIVTGIFLLAACVSVEATPTAGMELPAAASAPYLTTIFKAESEAMASQTRLDDPRPNVIFIFTDDQPYHTTQYMPTVRDVLMKGGINFENGFSTTPLCCPSRASILSGEYVHNNEVYTNTWPLGGARKFDDTSTYAVWIKDAGYQTAYFGKYLNDYDALEPYGYVGQGWDEWGVFLGKNLHADDDIGASQYYVDFSVSENGNVVEYNGEKSIFGADLITQKAVDYISTKRNEPFILTMAYYNPHSPYFWAERHDPQFRRTGELQAEAYRSPNFMEEDVSDKPQFLQDLNPIAVEKIDISYKQILRSLLSVDDGVASVLNALDKTGLSEKTIIFFITDNGLTVGDHRFGLTKNCAYEACARIPFIVYSPAMFPARTDVHIVANIDLAPTFAELGGVAIPEDVNGMSLLPLLKDPNADWRDAVLIEHWPTEDGVGSKIPEFYAVRTADWKYVEYSTGEKELYDLINDPYELENLANKPQQAEIQQQLKLRLDELKKE
jgi:arylsulfatase A-like enzyme